MYAFTAPLKFSRGYKHGNRGILILYMTFTKLVAWAGAGSGLGLVSKVMWDFFGMSLPTTKHWNSTRVTPISLISILYPR